MKINKFRLWIPSEKRMIYPDQEKDLKFYIELDTFTLRQFEIDEGFIVNPQYYFDAIPMQYINCNDKNGKEIYEGDQILFERHYSHTLEKRIFIIKSDWEFSCGCCDYVYGYVLDASYDSLKSYCTVIGNIYENPDLRYKALGLINNK